MAFHTRCTRSLASSASLPWSCTWARVQSRRSTRLQGRTPSMNINLTLKPIHNKSILQLFFSFLFSRFVTPRDLLTVCRSRLKSMRVMNPAITANGMRLISARKRPNRSPLKNNKLFFYTQSNFKIVYELPKKKWKQIFGNHRERSRHSFFGFLPCGYSTRVSDSGIHLESSFWCIKCAFTSWIKSSSCDAILR